MDYWIRPSVSRSIEDTYIYALCLSPVVVFVELDSDRCHKLKGSEYDGNQHNNAVDGWCLVPV